MEKPPQQELGPEELDVEIERLLEKEGKLFDRYIELYGEPDEELDEREYWVVQESKVGKDRIQAKERLDAFTNFLEEEIGKKESS